jgi:hypothetical protein
MTYRLQHKLVNGLHVFTSPDVPGLYVANPDESVALGHVPEAVEAIRRINERREERESLERQYA